MVIVRKKRCSPKYLLDLQLWVTEISSLTKPIRENVLLIRNKMGTIPLVGVGTTYWLVNPTRRKDL